MLQYEGIIKNPIIKTNIIEKGLNMELLRFHDDELPKISCELIQERLDSYFKSDTMILVYYDKNNKQLIIEMLLFFDKKSETLINESKTSLEKYYAGINKTR